MNSLQAISRLLLTATLAAATIAFASLRQISPHHVVAALASFNPFRGPIETCITLIAAISALIVIDDWISGRGTHEHDDRTHEL